MSKAHGLTLSMSLPRQDYRKERKVTMTSDQQVSARAILRAESELRRLGHRRVMEQLEQIEPDLSSHLWERLSAIHQQLLNMGSSAQTTQRVYRQVQTLMLIGILSLRHGHYELWRDLVGDDDPPPSSPAE